MIDFSLYPNLNGNLGEKKVAIPDGITSQWPDGDALVGNFVYKNGKLVGFVDTKALIANDSGNTTIPYDFFDANLENVRESSMTFNMGDRCKYFTLKLMPKYKGCKTINDIKGIDENYIVNDIVDGVWTKELEDLENCSNMFAECDKIISFNTNLKTLMNGVSMFNKCVNLTTFDSDLSSLIYGSYMFHRCFKLVNFNSNLCSLSNSSFMFRECDNLTTFESDLSSLTNGEFMFYICKNLISFKSKLKSVKSGSYMFSGCSNLVTFKSDLSSLTNGTDMFKNCKLNTLSLKNIAETINTVTDSPSIMIGIGNATPTEEENIYLTQIHNKGWQVYVNGITDSNIFNPTSLIPIDGEQNLKPIPFWAKPVPSTEEEANYIDENGNYYNILGGQFIYVNDPETYGMFISEEDAAAQMRLIKIEKEEK